MDSAPTTDATRLRRLLQSPAVPDRDRVAAIEAMVQERSADEAAALLTEAGRDLAPDVLGYGLFPSLRRWLGSNEGFTAALGMLEDRNAEPLYRVGLLDFVDAAARASDRLDTLASRLRRLAATREEPTELRA